MRTVGLLVACLALAGCLGLGGAGGSLVLVVAQDLVAVHGSAQPPLRADFGPHCAHAVVEEHRIVLRYDLADAPLPQGLLVRQFDTAGSTATLVTFSSDMTGHVVLGPGQAPVRSPIGGGPLLGQATLQGDALRLGDEVLQPGRRATIPFSYQVEEGSATFDVEEALVLHHRGRVPVVQERGLGCM
jgi:hypothetical protein